MPTVIQPLPIEPSRDRPETFSAESDTFLSAFGDLRNQVNASNQEITQVVQSAITRANFVVDFRSRFFGSSSTNPTLRPPIPPAVTGAALEIGDLYYNTSSKEIRVYVGGSVGWRGIGSYVTGSITVNSFVKANSYIANQFSFKNAPTANLVVNQYSHFVIQTAVTTQLNFAYTPISPSSLDATSFTVDLLTLPGFSLSFPANVRWSNNTEPTLLANRRHLLKFTTSDSGATWIGIVEVSNASSAGAPLLT